MSRIVRAILLGGLAALAVTLVISAPASADDGDQIAQRAQQGNIHLVRDRYWGNYWNWYDRDYRPYRHRYHYGHGGRYGDGFYRYPHRYGDRYRYHPHGGAQFGPFRFEYWH